MGISPQVNVTAQLEFQPAYYFEKKKEKGKK